MKTFRVDDKVVYTGTKTFKDDKGNPFSLNGKIGVVYAAIAGEDTGVVVDFGDESFVMSEAVLEKWRGSKDKDSKEPEVTVRRRRHLDDDEA